MKTKVAYSNLRRILMIVIGVLMVIYALASSINDETLNLDSYHNFSIEHNLKDYVGVNQEKLEVMYSNLIEHIQTGDNSLLTDYFNEKEIMHMEDVYGLYKISFIIEFILFILILAILVYFLSMNARAFKKTDNDKLNEINRVIIDLDIIRKSIIISILFLLVIVLIGTINFNFLFTKFHEIFFSNDLWLLDPRTDIMIRMLPESYFYEKASGIFFRFITTIGLYLIIFTALKSFTKKQV